MLKCLKIVKGFIIDVLQILCHYCLLPDNLLYHVLCILNFYFSHSFPFRYKEYSK